MTDKITLDDKFACFDDVWSPKIVAECNGQLVKLAKGEGSLVWHAHAEEDELFLVTKGRLTIEMRDRSVELGPGELFVVPKGVEHRPHATPGTEILLVEPATTQHTGETVSDQTVRTEDQPWI